MGIVELPVWRLSEAPSGRVALRKGVARPVASALRVVKNESVPMFCDRCAAPIEFGVVTNGAGTYCSVECSLGGSSA
ncbi:MAG TPA: hypothetical protein VKT20_03975 [Candidatus Dormibacteraeota bacterium]|nr:hypothetical protein [Candidatus Dormibacteraeota bacterium]